MRRALFLLVLLAAILGGAVTVSAKVTKLDAADRKRLMEAQGPALVLTMREIPEEVVRACAAETIGKEFRLADAGQPFQVTDVISNEKLLSKRLIWGARLPGYFVVHYEHGGYAHTYHVLVVAVDGAEKARVVWSGLVASAVAPLKSYGAFREALAAGKLDDTVSYIP
jgi:hypothetical protein